MIKTHRYGLILSLFCFLTGGLILSVSVAQAQSSQVTEAQTAVETIDAKMTEQSNRIQALQDIVNERQALPDIGKLLRQLPVNNETIADKTKALTAQNIATEQITAVVQLSNQISQAIEQHQSYATTLEDGIAQLDTVQKALLALQQSLNNPLNQAEVAGQNQQLSRLLADAATLSSTMPQMLNQEKNAMQQATDAVTLLRTWQKSLMNSIDKRQSATQLADNQVAIETQIKKYETDIINFTARLSKTRNQLSLTEIKNLQAQIYIEQTYLRLLSIDKKLLHYLQQLPTVMPLQRENLGENVNPQALLTTVQKLLPQMTEDIAAIKTHQAEFERYTAVIGEQQSVQKAFDQRLQALTFQQLRLEDLQQRLQHRLTQSNQRSLFSRETLFQQEKVSNSLSEIPNALIQIGFQVQISIKQCYQQIMAKPWQVINIAVAMLLGVLLLRQLSALNVGRALQQQSHHNGLIVLLRKMCFVVKNRAIHLFVLLFIVALVRFSELPSPSDQIIRVLVYITAAVIVWFAFSTLEVRLGVVTRPAAYRSNVIAIVLALLLLLFALAKLSMVAQPLIALSEKALMLGIAGVAWSTQHYLACAFRQAKAMMHEPDGKTYSLYLLMLKVLPITVMSLCLLGIMGFTHLAWLLLGYVGILLLYFTVVALGIVLFNTTRKALKLASLKQFEHGAFIAQDIVNPLATLAKITWVLLCGGLLVIAIDSWYGNDQFLLVKLLEWLNMPLFSFADNDLSALSLLLLALSPFIIYRLAKWLRTFSFHWLFAGIEDIGVRHSLSIFSQYVVALLGVLVTLQIVGVDLTSFAVFAGALGVGVGLGLQDIAKNFISGILLLIERPLRSGDWVAIDGSEGTVKSIGMRAIIMETFDKQEVIIPNGNAISNSFTNYTHSDNVTRIVIYVGAGYDCDPDTVVAVLNHALSRTEAVLKIPKWQVMMWEYADSAVNYRVQYYIDVKEHGIYASRNCVLRNIWHDFKANHIDIPFPQRDIYVKNASALSDKYEDTIEDVNH